jgi:hypothetical protein
VEHGFLRRTALSRPDVNAEDAAALLIAYYRLSGLGVIMQPTGDHLNAEDQVAALPLT